MRIIKHTAIAEQTIINVPDNCPAPRYSVSVRDSDQNGRKMYVSTYYNGIYLFTRDPLYAKNYSAAVAKQHVRRLYEREG